MLGRHHFSLTVLTLAAIISPFMITHPVFAGIVLIGAAIGGLLPDVDSTDATIFHTNISGLSNSTQEYARIVSVFFPVFGYTAKYLIYKPAVRVYNAIFSTYTFTERHRGFMHSVLGIVTTVFLFEVYLLGIIGALQLYTHEPILRPAVPYVAVFGIGLGVGEVLHLLEDSCTKTGIAWNSPFHDWKMRGRISTTGDDADTWTQYVFILLLGFVTIVGIYFGLYDRASYIVAASIVMSVIILWFVFTVVVAQVRID